jgi:hypothetical protein
LYEKFEDTKGIISSEEGHTIQWAKEKRTNNNIQNTIQKTKYAATPSVIKLYSYIVCMLIKC